MKAKSPFAVAAILLFACWCGHSLDVHLPDPLTEADLIVSGVVTNTEFWTVVLESGNVKYPVTRWAISVKRVILAESNTVGGWLVIEYPDGQPRQFETERRKRLSTNEWIFLLSQFRVQNGVIHHATPVGGLACGQFRPGWIYPLSEETNLLALRAELKLKNLRLNDPQVWSAAKDGLLTNTIPKPVIFTR